MFLKEDSFIKRMVWLKETALRKPEYETVTGSLVSFETLRAAPLTQLLVAINPVQAGSGDPSYPDNVRAISGWTGIVGAVRSKNLLPPSIPTNVIAGQLSSTKITSATDARVCAIPVPKNTTLYIQKKVSDTLPRVVDTLPGNVALGDTGNIAVNTPVANLKGLTNAQNASLSTGTHEWLYIESDSLTHLTQFWSTRELMVHIGTARAEYAAPDADGSDINITFPTPPGTVYGCMLDVLTGALMVTHALISFDGSEDGWSESSYFMIRLGENGYIVQNSGICSHAVMNNNISNKNTEYGFRLYNRNADPKGATFLFRTADINAGVMTLAEFKTWLGTQAQNGTPLQALYELSNPVTYQLNPVTLATLKGQNTIWADCGDVTVTYRSN